jgi:hypothetical protein
MASELRVNTLKDAAGNNSIATSFVAGGSPKHFVRYNAIAQNTETSLNQSSLTDASVGNFSSNFTNVYTSASNKTAFVNSFNSTNGTSRSNGYLNGGIGMLEGNLSGTFIAQTASLVNFGSGTLGDAGTHGNTRDYIATHCMTLGDLA